MPPDCLIAYRWWLNNRHKRGRRNVNQAADTWNQCYGLITCHEWPLRDAHVKCWVCSWQWGYTDPAYVPDSSWSWPPTTHSSQPWNSLSSGRQLWLRRDIHPCSTMTSWEESCVKRCQSLEHANVWVSKILLLMWRGRVQGNKGARGEEMWGNETLKWKHSDWYCYNVVSKPQSKLEGVEQTTETSIFVPAKCSPR